MQDKDTNKPKLLYSFSYSIPAKQLHNILNESMCELIEEMLLFSTFAEANEVIAQIKAR